jgi:hypothetical protein
MLRLSEVDQVLIRYGDTMSLNALSLKVEGLLTPEQCGARLTQLLDTPDWMTAAQQDQLITQKMRLVIVELEEMSRTTRNAEVLIGALEKLGARLERRTSATERDLSTLYAFQGVVLLEAVDEALAHMKSILTKGDAISAKRWDDALETAIRKAGMKLSAYEPEALEPIELEAIRA